MFPIIEKWRLEKKYKKYTKVLSSVIYFLTISSSFTFFGSRFAETEKGRVAKLEQHKLELIKDNKLLAKEIREEVTSRVIDQILSNPNVEIALDRMEEISRNIQEAKADKEYLNFMLIAPKGALNHFQLNTFEDEHLKRYNLPELLLEHEQAFQKTYQQSAPKGADFYEANWERETANFNKGQGKGFDVGNASENMLKDAQETFKKGAAATPKKYSKYYSKYKEPLEKIIRKGYSATGEKWVKSFMETMGIDFPFLDQFLDPIVNSPVEDYVVGKVEAILNASAKQDGSAVEAILNDCGTEFGNDFAGKLRESEKFSKFNGAILANYEKSQYLQDISRADIEAEKAKAKSYFEAQCKENKFEKYRVDFYAGLKEDRYPLIYGERKKIIWNALDSWEQHKKGLILPMYFDKSKDIDSYFFTFFKKDPELLVTWAYCLPGKEPMLASGKPIDALKYYFNIHHESFADFLEHKTSDLDFVPRMRNVNGVLCPEG